MAITSDVRGAIRAANDTFQARFAARDASGVAALYTDQAWVMPPGGEVVKGTGAIRDFWQSVIDAGITAARLDSSDVEAFGDTAVEVGTYRLFAGDNEADHGKYIVEWKMRAGGDWRLHRDIWNTSVSR